MPELSPAYTEARAALLATSPEPGGMEATEDLPHVYGVIVDIGFSPLYTVAAFADGTTSAYDGNGGSVTGLGEITGTLVLGRGVLRAVEANLAGLRPARSTPLPAPDRVVFTVLTYEGRLGVEADGAALLRGRHPLSTAFNAVMGIMEQARHMVPRPDAAPPN
ncbi:MAG: hypothetical protein ABSC46_06615 [Candidatus Limnocylindrales bacterium]|jgi:hypothetical protein